MLYLRAQELRKIFDDESLFPKAWEKSFFMEKSIRKYAGDAK